MEWQSLLKKNKVVVFCTAVIVVIILLILTGATHLDEVHVILMVVLIAICIWEIITKRYRKKPEEDVRQSPIMKSFLSAKPGDQEKLLNAPKTTMMKGAVEGSDGIERAITFTASGKLSEKERQECMKQIFKSLQNEK